MEGLSLSAIGNKFGVSKEGVRQWILKFEEAFARKDVSTRKTRPIILLDETKVKRKRKDGVRLFILRSLTERGGLDQGIKVY